MRRYRLMEQMASQQTLSADVATAEHEATDWPPLSPEVIHWAIVIGGGIFAASVGALLGGAMSL